MIDHIGIGTDMQGLLGTARVEDYRQTPALAKALLAAGCSAADAARLLVGNDARVPEAVLPA